MAICIIGVAQETTRPPGPAPEPLESWERMARAAAADSGGSGVLEALDSVQVVFCQSWPYDDPAGRLNERLGISPDDTFYSGIGGTTPQQLVNALAERMLDGELSVAMVVGAEALATVRSAKQAEQRLAWSHRDPEKKPFPYEGLPDASESAHQLFHAWETFALWDNARRGRLGTPLREYEAQIGRMMSPMTEVAAANPHAWRPKARSAQELSEATVANRYIGFPHTRHEVSVIDVDMAAAVILATDEAADALGVAPEQRVYLTGWAFAKDPDSVSVREDMSRSAAMHIATGAALEMAGTTVDELGAFDLYSCFPSALNLGCDALGLDPLDERGLTVTGGLPFFGGPSSCYLLHSIASMVDTLRAQGGSGLVTGIGMHMSKHVATVYSTHRPERTIPIDGAALQAEADKQVVHPQLGAVEGEGTVVAYTVAHDRENVPSKGIVVVELEGGRALARIFDAALLADMTSNELVGRSVRLSTDGTINTASW